MSPEENQVMYQLEDLGLVKTKSEREILYDSKEWRTFYWVLNTQKIREMSKIGGKQEPNIYESISEEVWTMQAIDPIDALRTRILRYQKEGKIGVKTVNALIQDISGGKKIDGYGIVQELIHEGTLSQGEDESYSVRSVLEVKKENLPVLFSCKYCPEEFETKQELMVHIKHARTENSHVFPIEKLSVLLSNGKTILECSKELNLPKSTIMNYVIKVDGNYQIKERLGHGTKVPKMEDSREDLPVKTEDNEEEPKNENLSNNGQREILREVYEEKIEDLQEEIDSNIRENIRLRSEISGLLKTKSENLLNQGTLKSSIMISNFEGYLDPQGKMLVEVVKDQIHHAGVDHAIKMEIRDLPDKRIIIVEISKEEVKE